MTSKKRKKDDSSDIDSDIADDTISSACLCGGKHHPTKCKTWCRNCKEPHRYMDCPGCTYEIAPGSMCGNKSHIKSQHEKYASQVCRRCKDHHDKASASLKEQYGEAGADGLPKYFEGHTRTTSKSCCFYRRHLTHSSKNMGITTIPMSLGSFINPRLDTASKTKVQSRIDQAVLCCTIVGQMVLQFFNLYYRHRLENGLSVPELTEDLIKVVMDELVDIKVIGTSIQNLNISEVKDVRAYFQNHFAPLMINIDPVVGKDPIFNAHQKILAKGNKNPLIYLARSIKTICENHVVTNITRRVSKLLKALACSNLQSEKIPLNSYPTRSVIAHLMESGLDKPFTRPQWLEKRKSKLDPEDESRANIAVEKALEELKCKFLRGLSIETHAVRKSPASYFTLLFAIRRHFENERAIWNTLLKDIPTLTEQKALAMQDYRGGPLIKEFPLLPEFGDAWQCISICSATLLEWFGKKGNGSDAQQIYTALWREFFRPDVVIAKDIDTQMSDRSFHSMIRTDGVWVGVFVNTRLKVRRPKSLSEKPMDIPGVRPSTALRLAGLSPSRLLGKVLAVVDPGSTPIATVGYYKVSDGFGPDGKLEFEPYPVQTEDLRQRKWRQRNSRKKKHKKDKKHKKSNPAPVRHSHYIQISKRYWNDITGQSKRKMKLARWEREQGMDDLYVVAQQFPRKCPTSEYVKYIEFKQRTAHKRLAFRGRRNIRRMRLDGTIGKKRADGEICRRVLRSATVPKDQMVVIWGDGDFKHNQPGSSTTPCGRLRTEISKKTAGLLPGSEYKTSQQCPKCRQGQLTQHKINGTPITILKTCQSCSGKNGQLQVFERNIAAIIHILEGTLSIIETGKLPDHLMPKTMR